MTARTREESPFAFGLSLGGYFFGLVLLPQLAFILGPAPIAVNVLARRPNRAKVYVLVAILAGTMGILTGVRSPMVTCILYSILGWPIAWAILNRVAYKSLVMRVVACVFVTQVVLINLQWEQVIVEMAPTLEGFQEQRHGSEAGTLTDRQIVNLNMIIWMLENWRDVYLGFSFAGSLAGVCLSLGWIYRGVRRETELEPMGSFSDLRPHDAMVWFAIGTALLGFANSYWPAAWLQATALNTAIGLFALYLLNGFSILLYGISELRPNPILALVFLLVMFFFGGVFMLGIVGLFDTWGEFRKRIDARVQLVNDSDDRTE